MTARDPQILDGACHCGKVQFRVALATGFTSIRRCTCSYCRMRGAIAVSASAADFELIKGEQDLTFYQFNTQVAKHWFCGTCGIYTHHVRRSDPQMIGVNVACLKGVSPFDFPSVTVVDGVNHPGDSGGTSRAVGVLRFERLD